MSILDLGFGCGDQTIALTELVEAPKRPHFRYVGLTLNGSQMQTAQRSLDRAAAAGELRRDAFKLFRANAARPETWTGAIRSAVDSLADETYSQRWLLALDCLYHFSPSRTPVFKLAAETLDANVMAFDLVLDDKATTWNRLAVRLVGLLMSCPLRTFLTEEQYREQLVQCGYDGETIVLRDISDDVFAGVSEFLRRQEAALRLYGISIGGFKLAGRLFEWFDRTRVVRASIVVARTKKDAQ